MPAMQRRVSLQPYSHGNKSYSPTASTFSKFLALGALTVSLAGCALRREHGEGAELRALDDNLGWFIYGGDVVHPLPLENRREQAYDTCGHERGKIKLFSTGTGQGEIPVKWYDDNVWRSYARPAGPQGCTVDERADKAAGTCWRSYGIQFFPSSPIAQGNRVRVPGASPVIRVIPKSEFTTNAADGCKFDRDTALIWVAGVGNRGLGLSWSTTDNQLLANIMAWNRNANLPAAVVGGDQAGHDKLKDWPGYIQLVQNDNGPANGISGIHSKVAIETMLANLELAYRSGVKHVEVVTHSNGVITAQLAYALFSQQFNEELWKEGEWLGAAWSNVLLYQLKAKKDSMVNDRNASGAPLQMTVNFYHHQAAASQRWGSTKLDPYGFYSDLVPTAKWVKKSFLSVSYWGWDWLTPGYFAASNPYVRPAFRFYYNGADWMTDDYYYGSTVGRRESLPWQTEIRDHMQTLQRPFTAHYRCGSGTLGVCGPGHDQEGAMWYYASPAMPDTGSPIQWEVN